MSIIFVAVTNSANSLKASMHPTNHFNEHAYTVQLFVPYGDPNGLRVIEEPSWSGVGIAFPRTAYKDVSGMAEFSRTGVYLLVGPSTDGGALPRIYIGQGDRVKPRLDAHHRNKDFWEWAVFFVSRDNRMRVGTAEYVETRLIERAKRDRRCQLDNGNEPGGPTFSPADTVVGEAFLRHVLLLLPLVGLSVFEERKKRTTTKQRNALHLKGKGIKATGYAQAGGFIVCAGSTAVTKEVKTIHLYMKAIRKDLLAQGIVIPDLNSPSTAAGVLLGRTANGRKEWKDSTGKTLKTIQEAEAAD
jgi:hypothetical protein